MDYEVVVLTITPPGITLSMYDKTIMVSIQSPKISKAAKRPKKVTSMMI